MAEGFAAHRPWRVHCALVYIIMSSVAVMKATAFHISSNCHDILTSPRDVCGATFHRRNGDSNRMRPSKPDRCASGLRRSANRGLSDDPAADSQAGVQDVWLWKGEITRGRAIRLGFSGVAAGLTLSSRAGYALDPIRKMQELYRIRIQEEADNILGGGELASPEGGKTLQPVLALIPIVTLRLRLDRVEACLTDPNRFEEGLAILQSQEFHKKDIKRVFNAYSDNIYYVPGSERENMYLQGGATPSSRQTLQYMLRNDVVDNVEALSTEVAYLIRELKASEAEGFSKAYDSDEKDLRMYLAKCKEGFDRYLGMAFQNEIDEATEYARMALARAEGV